VVPDYGYTRRSIASRRTASYPISFDRTGGRVNSTGSTRKLTLDAGWDYGLGTDLPTMTTTSWLARATRSLLTADRYEECHATKRLFGHPADVAAMK